MVYTILKKDSEMFVLLFLAIISAYSITYSIKLIINFLALHFHDKVILSYVFSIAQRPINGEFNGMPSGHATTAFVSVAFSCCFLKSRWQLLFLLLSLLVGISRIVSLWHTPFQVALGSLIGFYVAYVVIKKANPNYFINIFRNFI